MLAVDEKTCNRDGICAAVCPMGIIDFSKGQLRRKLPPMPVNCASPAVTAWRCVPRPVSLTRKWRRSNARPFKRTFSCLPSSVSNFFAADDLFGHTRTNRFPGKILPDSSRWPAIRRRGITLRAPGGGLSTARCKSKNWPEPLLTGCDGWLDTPGLPTTGCLCAIPPSSPGGTNADTV